MNADNITFYSEKGAGNIEVILNAVQTFSYIMDEDADFTFHGTSDACYSYTNSRGSIDFSDFVVKKMIIEYGGLRDATINVTDDLNSILYYKGNLFYKGTPQITKNEVHSSGRLIPCELALLAMGFLHPQHAGLLNELEVALDERGQHHILQRKRRRQY